MPEAPFTAHIFLFIQKLRKIIPNPWNQAFPKSWYPLSMFKCEKIFLRLGWTLFWFIHVLAWFWQGAHIRWKPYILVGSSGHRRVSAGASAPELVLVARPGSGPNVFRQLFSSRAPTPSYFRAGFRRVADRALGGEDQHVQLWYWLWWCLWFLVLDPCCCCTSDRFVRQLNNKSWLQKVTSHNQT